MGIKPPIFPWNFARDYWDKLLHKFGVQDKGINKGDNSSCWNGYCTYVTGAQFSFKESTTL